MSRESGLKIKYIGAHLCDEKYKVRIQALKTLDVAYKNDGRFSVPTLFTKQWTERMVELTRDKHEKVVVEACKLLKTISYLDITPPGVQRGWRKNGKGKFYEAIQIAVCRGIHYSSKCRRGHHNNTESRTNI